LELVESSQNTWLRNFRRYFADSTSQHDTLGVSEILEARASVETAEVERAELVRGRDDLARAGPQGDVVTLELAIERGSADA
jgi:hypothetical protein